MEEFGKNVREKLKKYPLKAMSAEFLGTFVLICMGDSAMAIAVLGKFEKITLLCVAFAWGIAITSSVLIAGGISGGHLNPAVTFAFATVKKCPWNVVIPYMISQYLAGFFAAAVVYMVYYDGIKNFAQNERLVPPADLATAQIFCTWPEEFVSTLTCFADQIVSTGILLVTVCAITDIHNLKVLPFSQPLLIGFVVTAVLLAYGYNCMCPLNPARDLSPRIFIALFGWGSKAFTLRDYNYFWIGIIGPHLGAIVGVWIYELFIEMHHDCKKHPTCDHKSSILFNAFPTKDEATETDDDNRICNSDSDEKKI